MPKWVISKVDGSWQVQVWTDGRPGPAFVFATEEEAKSCIPSGLVKQPPTKGDGPDAVDVWV